MKLCHEQLMIKGKSSKHAVFVNLFTLWVRVFMFEETRLIHGFLGFYSPLVWVHVTVCGRWQCSGARQPTTSPSKSENILSSLSLPTQFCSFLHCRASPCQNDNCHKGVVPTKTKSKTRHGLPCSPAHPSERNSIDLLPRPSKLAWSDRFHALNDYGWRSRI